RQPCRIGGLVLEWRTFVRWHVIPLRKAVCLSKMAGYVFGERFRAWHAERNTERKAREHRAKHIASSIRGPAPKVGFEAIAAAACGIARNLQHPWPDTDR